MMRPVSNVDQLVLLLQQRLRERLATRTGGPGPEKGAGLRPKLTALSNLQALAAASGIDDRQLRRALLQGLLADKFGDHMKNDAKFQRIVDRVTEAIEGDADAAKLLTRVVDELRAIDV